MHGDRPVGGQAQDFDVLCRELATTDVLVVLGGDGTFLRAARAVIRSTCRCLA
jgi:NAD kinase